jgi:hypothetical protein
MGAFLVGRSISVSDAGVNARVDLMPICWGGPFCGCSAHDRWAHHSLSYLRGMGLLSSHTIHM